METIKNDLLNAGCKVWEKGAAKRIYINEKTINSVFGFKTVSCPKYAKE